MDEQQRLDLHAICRRPDPADYYAALARLKSVLTDSAGRLLRRIARARGVQRSAPPRILDVGCGYGALALSLRSGLSMQDLTAWYGARRSASQAEAEARDARFFARAGRRLDCSIVGVDAAAPAARYAVNVGAIDEAVLADLEKEPLAGAAASAVRDVDLIVSASPLGRVSARAVTHLMLAYERWRAPWVALFLPRAFDQVALARNLARFALTTELLGPVTFVQRRYLDGAEYDEGLKRLRRAGVDASGREADGLVHACLLVARPASDIDRMPLRQLLGEDPPFRRGEPTGALHDLSFAQ